jgi:hypothetical protein
MNRSYRHYLPALLSAQLMVELSATVPDVLGIVSRKVVVCQGTKTETAMRSGAFPDQRVAPFALVYLRLINFVLLVVL